MASEIPRKYQYYLILEVKRQATQEDIDASYRRLAKIYHPDKNPALKAHELFKNVNQAYQVLGNAKLRQEYDNSPAECPDCWDYKVIQTVFPYWRCHSCGCRFNPAAPNEIKRFSQSSIPEKLRKKLELFSSTQCSSCRKFYTQPFLCPEDRLASSCRNFDALSAQDRERNLEETKWHWRISDMLEQVLEHGTMTRCHNLKCGALNPNPKTKLCWRCKQDTLCCSGQCPGCKAKLELSYNIDTETWKCPNNAYNKVFAFRPKKAENRSDISQKAKPRPDLQLSKEVCPFDKSNLYYDPLILLWECKKCNRKFTYQELFGEDKHNQPADSVPTVFEVCPKCGKNTLQYHKSGGISYEFYKCSECSSVFGHEELKAIRKKQINDSVEDKVSTSNPRENPASNHFTGTASPPIFKQDTKSEQLRQESEPVRESGYKNIYCPRCKRETYFDGNKCQVCHKEFNNLQKIKERNKPNRQHPSFGEDLKRMMFGK